MTEPTRFPEAGKDRSEGRAGAGRSNSPVINVPNCTLANTEAKMGSGFPKYGSVYDTTVNCAEGVRLLFLSLSVTVNFKVYLPGARLVKGSFFSTVTRKA